MLSPDSKAKYSMKNESGFDFFQINSKLQIFEKVVEACQLFWNV